MKINLLYKFNFKILVVINAISIFILLSIYYLHPSNINWFEREDFSIINLLQFIVIDQYLLELVSTTIIIYLVKKYMNFINLKSLETNFSQIIVFYFKAIPIFFTAYFFFAPITINIRYFYHNTILDRPIENYIDGYFFFSSKIYIGYLPFVFLVLFQYLTYVTFESYKQSKTPSIKRNRNFIDLYVKTNEGETIVNTEKIVSIVKEGNNYIIYTDNDRFKIVKNLSELEKILDKYFVRINRSAIINLEYYKDFSFWENEKYIFRMKNGQEFNITRLRLKKIKKLISDYNQKSTK